MVKSPKIKTLRELGKEREEIKESLLTMLQDVEIVLKPSDIDEETGRFEDYKVTGFQCVWEVMRAMAGETPMFSRILDLESFVSNPLNQRNYQAFYDEEDNWRGPNLDELCAALNIRPGQFLGTFFDAVKQYGLKRAKMKIDLTLHEVVEAAKSNAVAQTPTSWKDRETLLKAAKLLENGGGVQVNVSQTNQMAVGGFPGSEQGLPAWKDAKQLAMETAAGGGAGIGAGRDVKQLGEGSGVDFVEGEFVEEGELEPAYVPSRRNS